MDVVLLHVSVSLCFNFLFDNYGLAVYDVKTTVYAVGIYLAALEVVDCTRVLVDTYNVDAGDVTAYAHGNWVEQ